ncbi:NUDIX hydrolase [Rhodospirillaceae bacterium KN72]|uniref:NUDIX hydrolase n=1 Tax=Pacificispira spongiicola TaxID=2729598 RepID=A0A7Y0E034_9PROT|nr:NUDIX hydrolase [Pacificispira spongiicola]NMM44773.1 NUDIX hydrolase [Pacificispira spongiicola]
MTDIPQRPLIGIGTIVLRDTPGAVEVLLIRRGTAPEIGRWSLPGGKQDFGEGVRDAARREVLEETGIAVEIQALLDVVDMLPSPANGDRHYTLINFRARPVGGTLQAGDDAMDARWVPLTDLDDYNLWVETRRVIELAARHKS